MTLNALKIVLAVYIVVKLKKKSMKSLTVYPKNEKQEKALKELIKSLEIPFEEDIQYNSEFIDKINKGKEDISEGKGIEMTLKDFQNLCK